MLKLLHRSTVYLGINELKQCLNPKIIHKCSLNPTSEFNLIFENNLIWRKHYCTQQEREVNKDGNIQVENPHIKAIIAENPELEQKLKVLILEADVFRQDGHNVPSESFLKKEYWQELLKLGSRSGRSKYLNFLFKLEMKGEHQKMKKIEKRLAWEERSKMPRDVENNHLIYDLTHNNIFLRIYESTINNLYNGKLIEAIMFGQPLVVDCGYDNLMTKRENTNCAKQLMFLFAENRMHDDPYNLHFCNFIKGTDLEIPLHKHIATMYDPSFPLYTHEESYLEMFSKDKLIYLTPNARDEMLEYDHDAVYIIGAIVDKTNHQPVSFAKAKREGLKMLRLPLDRYLNWGSGSGKSLTVNQMILIMLDIKRTGDWNYALRHVPKRKLLNDEIYLKKEHNSGYNKNLDIRNNTAMKDVKIMENTFGRHRTNNLATKLRYRSNWKE